MPYSIIPNKTVVKEGDLVTFTLTFDHSFLGKRAYLKHVGSSKRSDWLQNLQEENNFLVSTTTYVYSVLTRIDSKDEVETIVWQIKDSFGQILAISPTVYIDDSSYVKIFKPRWEKTGFLGTITAGTTSELYIRAYPNTSTFSFNYIINNGILPPGLSLNNDGTISGKPSVNISQYSTTTNYSFNISAVDRYNNVFLTSDFSINVKQISNNEFVTLYFQPLWPIPKRREYKNFVLNPKIFPPNFIYRPADPNFGLKYIPRLILSFGILRDLLSQYGGLITDNFTRRKFQLLQFKTGKALDSAGNILHEIIYIEVFDRFNPNLDQNVDYEFKLNGITYYGPSIKNQRTRLSNRTMLTDKFNPTFIKNIPKEDLQILNFKSFIPVCFTKPGKSQAILRNIKESGFKLNLIDFEVDRVYIENPIVDYPNPTDLQIPDGPFLVTVNSQIISEGNKVTFNIITKNVEEGTTATYQLNGITSEDLVGSPPLDGVVTINLPPIPRYTNLGKSGQWHIEQEFKLSNNIKGNFLKKGKEIIVSEEIYWNLEYGISGISLGNYVVAAQGLGLRAGILVNPYAISGDGVRLATASNNDIKNQISISNCDFVAINPFFMKTNGINMWTTSSLLSWSSDMISYAQGLGKYTKIIQQGFADPGFENTVLHYNSQLRLIQNVEEFIISDLKAQNQASLNNYFPPQPATTSLSFTLINDRSIEAEFISLSCRGSSANVQIIDLPYTDKYLLLNRKPPLK